MAFFRFILLVLVLTSSMVANANHWFGGEITWVCNGNNQYVFELKLYRDCNGPIVSTNSQTLRVWNHSSLTSMNALFVDSIDITPSCKAVPGGPSQLTCATMGSGTVQQFVYRTNPITLLGTPPSQGWVFTWDGFTRNNAVSNLVAPNTKGLTILSKMYQNVPCDNSPQILEPPSSLLCAGYDFVYNINAVDYDLDSLSFSFATPLDRIVSSYNPPADPPQLVFTPNYSVNSPLPGMVQNAANIPAAIDNQSGEITFKSFTIGAFIVVIKIESWRNGQLISEVYRDMQFTIINCTGNNNPPQITPPFAGARFDTTISVGSTLNFTLNAFDNDTLQDGSPQSVILTPTSMLLGSDPTQATACVKGPCANLNAPLSAVTTISSDFSWTTDCSHFDGNNANQDTITYYIVYRVSDDYCPAPGINYATVRVNVVNTQGVDASSISCFSVNPDGSIYVEWSKESNPNNSFLSYKLYRIDNIGTTTLIADLTNHDSTSFTDRTSLNTNSRYFVVTESACNYSYTSDTTDNLSLTLSNPGNGTAILQWNQTFAPSSTWNGWYYIYFKTPTSNWRLLDSTQYNNEFYRDTIMVCADIIEYQIRTVNNLGCETVSNIESDFFEDKMAPLAPEIINVNVTHPANNISIHWNPTRSQDTRGYIILKFISGGWVPIDTVYGRLNTSYVDNTATAGHNIFNYGIAAFDSCLSGVPPQPNTSPMSLPHNSVLTTSSLDICDHSIELNWNPYSDWINGVREYNIYLAQGNGTFSLQGTTTNTDYTIPNLISDSNYCVYVEAVSNDNVTTNSNLICFNAYYPKLPDTNYIQSVSVENNNQQIELRILSDENTSIQGYEIEYWTDNINSITAFAGMAPNTGVLPVVFQHDENAEEYIYSYRIAAIDSCGVVATFLDTASNIHLDVLANNGALSADLEWNAYTDFDGGVSEYRIYKSSDGINFDLHATIPGFQTTYQDDVSADFTRASGNFYYYIQAMENLNRYGFADSAKSNIESVFMQHRIFIPNAIIQNDALRGVFKPRGGFIRLDNYRLTIFNRWSEKIYESTSFDQGWNGTYKGEDVPIGVYIYILQFRDAESKFHELSGTVTVVK